MQRLMNTARGRMQQARYSSPEAGWACSPTAAMLCEPSLLTNDAHLLKGVMKCPAEFAGESTGVRWEVFLYSECIGPALSFVWLS